MKKLLTGVSLFILTAIFTTQVSAQFLSSAQKMTASANKSELKTPGDKSSVGLAAVVFTSVDDKEKIRVHFENYSEGKVSVKLSYLGSVIHQELSEEGLYRRKFDMHNLPLGEYTIAVTNNKQVYTKKVRIKRENGVRILSII